MKATIETAAARAELAFLNHALGNKSVLADLFGLHRSTVGRWSRKSRPDSGNALKVAALRLILLKLQTLYKPPTAEKWLMGINAYLHDQRPIDLVKQGRFLEVLSAIEQDEGLGYA